MKITLSKEQVVTLLLSDEYACWTRDGAAALADWLMEQEEYDGDEWEMDLTLIRSQYAEYASTDEAAKAYGWPEGEQSSIDWLEQKTAIYTFGNGVLIFQSF